MSWGHRLVSLDSATAWCQGGRKPEHVAPALYRGSYTYTTGRSSVPHGNHVNLCAQHAAAWAARHGLPLPPERPGVRDRINAAHAARAGALCLNDGSGCCGACGVSLTLCPECQGKGYHRQGCQGGGL